MAWAYILQLFSAKIKIKILDLQNTRRSLLKRAEGTYHHKEKLTKEMPGFFSPGKGVPLLLIPEYSGINKGQRFPHGSKTAHGKPPVKCFLTPDGSFLGAALGLHCCVQAVLRSRGYSLVVVCWPLVVERGSRLLTQQLWLLGLDALWQHAIFPYRNLTKAVSPALQGRFSFFFF